MKLTQKSFIKYLLISTLVLAAFPGMAPLIQPQDTEALGHKIDPPDEIWVGETLAQLSLREKIGQLIQIRINGKFINRQNADFLVLKEKIVEDHVGGVVLFAGNVYESAILINELQSLSDLPLLVSADFERGASFRISDTTSFPYAMAIGASGSEQLSYQQGKITGQEARALGVHWIFAPVMDVNNNPNNPVINIRSYGEDPHLVARMGASFIRGARSAGVLTTAKHFPGHGDTAVDSHVGLAVIPSNMERLHAMELIPFKSAIEAGVDAVMTAHVAAPAITGEPGTPATLSPTILTNLLRDTLQFNGLVVTDAMEMGGITNTYWCGLAATRAIAAGADIVLLPPDATVAINEIERAVKRGDIPVSRIDQSVVKILRAKSSLGLHHQRSVPVDRIADTISSPPNEISAQETADRSITVVKDMSHILPVNPVKNPRIFSLVLDSGLETSPGSVFQSALKKRFSSVRTEWANARIDREQIESIHTKASQSDLIICSTFIRLTSGRDSISIPKDQKTIIEKLLGTGKPFLWISFGNPYVLRLFPKAGTYICTFSYSDVSQIAAVKAISGEIPVSGKMPISIPGHVPIGTGLQIPRLEMTLKSDPEKSADAPSNTFEKTTRLISSYIQRGTFSSVDLIVGRKGAVVLKISSGITGLPDVSGNIPSAVNIYPINSLKDIVGTVTGAMLAMESGDLLLNAPVRDYLPERHSPDSDRIRIVDILSGVGGGSTVSTDPSPSHPAMIEEVVARASGMTVNRLLATKLFLPIGMHGTYYEQSAREMDRSPKMNSDPRPKMFSSASDLSVYAQMLLNKGIYNHRRYFSPETLTRFTGNLRSRGSQILGWMKPVPAEWTGRLFSPTAFGYIDAGGNLLWIDPAEELFIVLLASDSSPETGGSVSEAQESISTSIVEAIKSH